MYKHLIHCLLLTFLLATTACKNDEDTPQPPTTAEKTIFVFMPNSDNLYSDFLNNISDMKNAIISKGGLGNTRLIIFIANGKQNSALINIKYEGGKCRQDTLEKFTSPTYLTVEGRTELFNKVKQYAPAHTYGTIIGCHGNGWIPKPSSSKKIISRYFGGLSAGYQIDIDEFAQSITNAGMKMQFILFDDCYLSCIEVAYDLKDVTDYIIASTSEIMQYGMPYRLIYGHLMDAEPDYKAICDDFYSFYSKGSMPYGTIGVTDCKYIYDIVAVMRNINATHTFDESLLDDIQDLDGKTFTPTIFYDFGDYVRLLCGNDIAAYSQFTDAMQRLVPYKAATNYIYSGSKNVATKVNSFSGMAISDPSTNTQVKDAKTNTNWWKATH